jgi:hypothetical protein
MLMLEVRNYGCNWWRGETSSNKGETSSINIIVGVNVRRRIVTGDNGLKRETPEHRLT